MADRARVGLCFDCRWSRTVANRRGSVFYRCLRSDTDPAYPRYPPLPVLACAGYERVAGEPEDRSYFPKTPTP